MPKKKTALTIEERLQQALVPVEEQPYEVPENWVWVRLGAIAEIVTGGTPSKKHPEYYGGNFPFYKPSDLDQGRLTYDASEYLSEEGKKVSRIIPKNSTAVCCIGSIGKCGYLMCEGTTNQQINSAIPKINSLCLYYYLCTENFVQNLLSMASATTITIVNKSKMESCAFPLPPLSEQQRIVERIEELFAKLDEAKERLQEVADSFAVRKAAILHKAFTGELTQQWRRENGVSDESWEEKKLHEVAFVQTGVMKGKHYNGETKLLPYLRVANVQDGYLKLDEIKEIAIDVNLIERYSLRKGDVLFTEGGDYDKLGRGTVWNNEIPGCLHQNHVFAVRPNTSILFDCFLAYQSNSRYGKKYFLSCSKQTTNLASINSTQLKNFPVLLPSLPEQHEIVRLIDDLLARERAAQQAAEQALASIDLMKKSILARAFRGELGTNKASEASALELLRQVLAEG